jgi:16S rRNA (guanine527-N7)-methyltransferase
VPGALPDDLRPTAERLFGESLPLVERYAMFLATEGLTRGLLGPREADRIWDRHLFNSAVVAELLPDSANVLDVGSGAGLPGLPLALARPDLRMVLLEPMLRRTTFLSEVIADLEVADRVAVVRGRAPDTAKELPFLADCAVARAVAPLDRLVSWTMPVVRPDGVLLALRGASAEHEVRSSKEAITRAGGSEPSVLRVGGALLADPVTVVRVVRRPSVKPRKGTRR